jgi:hypothetical protein
MQIVRAIALRLARAMQQNIYVVLLVVFLVWISFFDSYSILSVLGSRRRVHALRTQQEYYTKRIAAERQRLHELRTDRENLEKFARESYYMSRPNEDVYVVGEE